MQTKVKVCSNGNQFALKILLFLIIQISKAIIKRQSNESTKNSTKPRLVREQSNKNK